MEEGLGDASREKLLEVGLDLKALTMDYNLANMRHYNVIVDEEGKTIKGGLGRV